MHRISRRRFTQGLAAAGGLLITAGPASAAVTTAIGRPAGLPKPKGQRVVVVGGGWSGLTIAKYVKEFAPELDVVLVEKRSTFISHPLSNLWLAGLVSLETLTYSFLDAANNHGYTYFNATVLDVDRPQRRVFTDKGFIGYDFLVLAPGVEYDYPAMGIEDPDQIQLLKTRYPAGFVSPSEHITLKRKVNRFRGGLFLLTAPPGRYRCSASPYERACLIAAVFQRRKIKGKVVLIDSREQPSVTPEGFVAAFDELYPDHIEYMSSTEIEGVDPVARQVTTTFDDITFDDAAFYPPIRGPVLLEHLGLVNPESPQKEAHIDHFTYNIVGDKRVYAAGDCRPMPFSKSASAAHTEGIYVARVIAARSREKEVPWESPRIICYSVVDASPQEAIKVDATYRFDKQTKQWDYQTSVSTNDRSSALARENLAWARARFNELLL